jgi:ribosome-associated translation inhibitor RaiA
LRIDVTRDDVDLSASLRGKVVRRVLLALSRFGPNVTKVSVRLAEPANPLGGVDQRCRMRAWLHGRDGIRAEAINDGFEAAVTRAAAQLAKRLIAALDGAVPIAPPMARAPRAARRRT